ncbi:hypothetical protein T439DRAFT_376677 [Meredithblackwellia eburnea MCA 4105]
MPAATVNMNGAGSATVYTEPQYLLAQPTTSILSEARPLHLSTGALLSLNYLQDELLHLTINAALGALAINPNLSPASPPTLSIPLGPLAPNEVLTTERIKAGLIRVVGPLLGKNAVLEAELAVRELLRLGPPSLHGDAALRKSSFGSTNVQPGARATQSPAAAANQVDDIFRSLRAYVQLISGLGLACPPTGPATMSNHLIAVSPPPPPPAPNSPHLTFITALYTERCLTYLADYILRGVGRVTERESRKEAAGLRELEAALGEDESIWTWLKSMRVRAYIEAEIANSNARSSNSSGHNHGSVAGGGSGRDGGGGYVNGGAANGSPSGLQRRATVNGNSGTREVTAPGMTARGSYDSTTSGATGLAYGKREREPSLGLGISDAVGDEFEQLMQSGKTMKVSLTPDRLRTMEKRGNRNSVLLQSASMPSLVPPTPAAAIAAANSSPSPPKPLSASQGARRLQARGARMSDFDEDEDEDDLDDFGGRRRNPKESLMELLSTPPPWQENNEKFAPDKFVANSPQGSISSRLGSAPGSAGPISAPMAHQDSQASVRSEESMRSSGSEYQEANPGVKGRIKAKDERADLAHERQINYDLVDFFANNPPPLPSHDSSAVREREHRERESSTGSTERPSSAGAGTNAQSQSPTKKRSGGIRGLMSKVKGGSVSGQGGKGRDADQVSVAPTQSSHATRSSIDTKYGSPSWNQGKSGRTSQSGTNGYGYTPPSSPGGRRSDDRERGGSIASYKGRSTNLHESMQEVVASPPLPPIPASSDYSPSPASVPPSPVAPLEQVPSRSSQGAVAPPSNVQPSPLAQSSATDDSKAVRRLSSYRKEVPPFHEPPSTQPPIPPAVLMSQPPPPQSQPQQQAPPPSSEPAPSFESYSMKTGTAGALESYSMKAVPKQVESAPPLVNNAIPPRVRANGSTSSMGSADTHLPAGDARSFETARDRQDSNESHSSVGMGVPGELYQPKAALDAEIGRRTLATPFDPNYRPSTPVITHSEPTPPMASDPVFTPVVRSQPTIEPTPPSPPLQPVTDRKGSTGSIGSIGVTGAAAAALVGGAAYEALMNHHASFHEHGTPESLLASPNMGPDTPSSLASPVPSGDSPESTYDEKDDIPGFNTARRPSTMTMRSVKNRVSGFELEMDVPPVPEVTEKLASQPEENEVEEDAPEVAKDVVDGPSPAIAETAPTPSKGTEVLPIGTTLIALKIRMAAATSVEECVALLDSFILHQKENSNGLSPATVVEEPLSTSSRAVSMAISEAETVKSVDGAKVPSEIAWESQGNWAQVAQEREENDLSLGSMAEFFLGDFPSSPAAQESQELLVAGDEEKKGMEEGEKVRETNTMGAAPAMAPPNIFVDDGEHSPKAFVGSPVVEDEKVLSPVAAAPVPAPAAPTPPAQEEEGKSAFSTPLTSMVSKFPAVGEGLALAMR